MENSVTLFEKNNSSPQVVFSKRFNKSLEISESRTHFIAPPQIEQYTKPP